MLKMPVNRSEALTPKIAARPPHLRRRSETLINALLFSAVLMAFQAPPSLEGFWNNAAGSAPWDVEPHPAAFQVPAGEGIIVEPADHKIPYKPEALAKRNDVRDHHSYD